MSDEITPDELDALLDTDEPVRVVDIRSAAAFERGHIPTSENIPFAELTQRVESLADAERIVAVCPHGKASLQAVRLFDSAESIGDARVESLAGGLEAWNGDIETTDESATTDDIPAGDAPDAPF
ncbi:MAG TPA: rhodanese-like domain-containing protein [Halococcus sp.]|nr:rhodanese-like domain-containing protein [Halococcus sp.]